MNRRIAAVTVTITAGACLWAPAAAAAGTPTAVPVPAPPPSATVVTLITGDRVAVSTGPDGRPQVTFPPGTAGAGFQVFSAGPHLYVIPQDATGSIGQPLDPSLFDVNALVAGGYTDPATPVRIAVTAMPGATPAPPAGMTAAGPGELLAPRARAAEFGTALRELADAVTHGRPAGPLFGGIARLALAGTTGGTTTGTTSGTTTATTSGTTTATTSGTTTGTTTGPEMITSTADTAGTIVPPGQPADALYTVRVKVFDRDGRRANSALVDAMNADDVDSYLAGAATYLGEVAFSVPAGTYSIASYVPTVHPDGSYDFTLVSLPNVAVTRDTEVVLDARGANPVGAVTPRPATQVNASLSLQRDPATGVSFTTVFEVFGDVPLYATPTDPVTVGSLYFYPAMRLGDASGADRYVYDLEFPYSGAIPASLDLVVTAGQLATIDARYHSAQPGRTEFDGRAMYQPWQAYHSFVGANLAAPLERTEYVMPVPGMVFQHVTVLDADSFTGYMSDMVRSYRPGQRSSEDWAAAPMAPGVEQEPTAPQPCPACRSGDTLNVLLFPATDADGHLLSPGDGTTASLAEYINGVAAANVDGSFAQLPMSPDPASYRLVLDSTAAAPWAVTATRVSTEWDFSSAEGPADTLPPGWTCPGGGGGGGGGKSAPAPTGGGGGGCSFVPLLFPRYRLAAGLDDVIPAGTPASVDVTVADQMGEPPIPVTGLTASVSFDDGTTWQAAGGTADGGGRYTLSYPQPALAATSGFASLRLTATDAAGNSVTQTIIRAYPLAVQPSLSAATGTSGSGTGSSGSGSGSASGTPACPGTPDAPYARCLAVVDTAGTAGTAAGAAPVPTGYGPADLASAYRLPVDRGAGRTIAIVDAYDNPNVAQDLANYRAYYGLPPCTTANGCFRKVNQRGAAAPLPSPDPGWGLEIDLDVQAASATCPLCHILLVEADSSSIVDLGPAVRTAVALGADVVSNSYGSFGEFAAERYFEPYYDQPVPVVASSGDYGYGNGAPIIGGVGYPAASRYVVAVGGTSLTPADNARGWAETAWGGATSGCSAYIHKPGWQKDPLCSMRTVADVAAVADPATGLSVYDSYGWWNGWLTVGGTSAAAPVIAGVYALAGPQADGRYAADPYADPAGLFDVTAGSNGSCGGGYLCTAAPGYDGPTGLGTPDGVGAF